MNLHVSAKSEEGCSEEGPIFGPQGEDDPRETEGAVVGKVAVHSLRLAGVGHAQIEIHQLIGDDLLGRHLEGEEETEETRRSEEGRRGGGRKRATCIPRLQLLAAVCEIEFYTFPSKFYAKCYATCTKT